MKRCECLKTRKFYAVKIIKSRDDELVGNVRKEFDKLRSLAHANIISVHELIIDRLVGAMYLVMELFDGREMFELLSDIGAYDGELSRARRQVPLQAAAARHPLFAQAGRGAPRPEAEQHTGVAEWAQQRSTA